MKHKHESKLWIKYKMSHAEYRKVYAKWHLSYLRGNDFTLEYYLENRDKTIRAPLKKMKRNKSYYVHRRLLKVALATPKWVNIEEIATFYENRPKGSNVDHIIPINHKLVCGLNVPWNLQYLSQKENNFKRNKF